MNIGAIKKTAAAAAAATARRFDCRGARVGSMAGALARARGREDIYNEGNKVEPAGLSGDARRSV